MDPDAAQLWTAERVVPPAGRFGGVADIAASPRAIVEHRAPHIQHMQKALLQMNIQLSQAVTDVTGVTGQKIIRAIVAGMRKPEELATLRDPGCKHSGRGNCESTDGNMAGRASLRVEAILGVVRFLHRKDRSL